MKLLTKYLGKNKKPLVLALFITALWQFFSLLDPQIFRMIVDNYVAKAGSISGGEFFKGIAGLLLASIGIAFGARLTKNLQDYYVNVITQRVGAAMYGESVNHSFSLPYSVFEDQRSGELLEKLQQARLDAQRLIATLINIVFYLIVAVLLVTAYAFTVNWVLGFTYIMVIPVLAATSFFITNRIKVAQAVIVKETTGLAGSTTETMRNVELVKSLGLEAQEIERLNSVNEKILGLELNKIRQVRALSFIQGTILNTLRSGILLLLLWFIFKGVVSVGEFFTLFIYSFFIFNPLNEIGSLSSQYQESRASMEQLQKVLSIKSESKPKEA